MYHESFKRHLIYFDVMQFDGDSEYIQVCSSFSVSPVTLFCVLWLTVRGMQTLKDQVGQLRTRGMVRTCRLFMAMAMHFTRSPLLPCRYASVIHRKTRWKSCCTSG